MARVPVIKSSYKKKRILSYPMHVVLYCYIIFYVVFFTTYYGNIISLGAVCPDGGSTTGCPGPWYVRPKCTYYVVCTSTYDLLRDKYIIKVYMYIVHMGV